jgi:hypothetical protein
MQFLSKLSKIIQLTLLCVTFFGVIGVGIVSSNSIIKVYAAATFTYEIAKCDNSSNGTCTEGNSQMPGFDKGVFSGCKEVTSTLNQLKTIICDKAPAGVAKYTAKFNKSDCTNTECNIGAPSNIKIASRICTTVGEDKFCALKSYTGETIYTNDDKAFFVLIDSKNTKGDQTITCEVGIVGDPAIKNGLNVGGAKTNCRIGNAATTKAISDQCYSYNAAKAGQELAFSDNIGLNCQIREGALFKYWENIGKGNFGIEPPDGKRYTVGPETMKKMCGDVGPALCSGGEVAGDESKLQAEFTKACSETGGYKKGDVTCATAAGVQPGSSTIVNTSPTANGVGGAFDSAIAGIFGFLIKIVLGIILIILLLIEYVQAQLFLVMSVIIATLLDLSPTSSVLESVAKPIWAIFVGIANFVLVAAVVWIGVQVMVGLKKVSEVTNSLLYIAVYALIENTTFTMIAFVVYIMDSFAKLLVFIFAGGDLTNLLNAMGGLFGSISSFRTQGSIVPDKFLDSLGAGFDKDPSALINLVVGEVVIVIAMMFMILIYYKMFIVVISRVTLLILLMITSPIWVLGLLLDSTGLVTGQAKGMLDQIKNTLFGLVAFNTGFVVILVLAFRIGQESLTRITAVTGGITPPNLFGSVGGVVASAQGVVGGVSGMVVLAQWITVSFIPFALTLSVLKIGTDFLVDGAIPKIIQGLGSQAASVIGNSARALGTADINSMVKATRDVTRTSLGLGTFKNGQFQRSAAGDLIEGAAIGSTAGTVRATSRSVGLVAGGIGNAANLVGLKGAGNYMKGVGKNMDAPFESLGVAKLGRKIDRGSGGLLTELGMVDPNSRISKELEAKSKEAREGYIANQEKSFDEGLKEYESEQQALLDRNIEKQQESYERYRINLEQKEVEQQQKYTDQNIRNKAAGRPEITRQDFDRSTAGGGYTREQLDTKKQFDDRVDTTTGKKLFDRYNGVESNFARKDQARRDGRYSDAEVYDKAIKADALSSNTNLSTSYKDYKTAKNQLSDIQDELQNETDPGKRATIFRKKVAKEKEINKLLGNKEFKQETPWY